MKTQNLDLGGAKFLAVSQEGTVAVQESEILLNSDYSRDGNDLHLEAPDGSHVVVADYFGHASPPALVSADGQMLSGETVALLAGPRAPGQYAEGVAGQFGEPIGQVESLSGSATAQRSNGLTVELSVGDPVFKGDVVSAGDGGTLGITFLDKTVFTISDGATMVLNEMVYDPAGSSNSMLFNLIGGTAAFVAGAVAKSGDMKIETPVAVMAIRGTTPFAACGGPGGCVFGGEEGVYNLLHKIGGQILATVSDPSIVVKLDGVNGTPVVSAPDPVTQAIMQNIFGALHDAVGRLEERTENGEELIRNAGTGSPDFSDGSLIESIAGFFKSALSTLLNEANLLVGTEPKSSLAELSPDINPPLLAATDEDTSFVIQVITEDDILMFGTDIEIVSTIITSGLGSTRVSDDGRAVIYDPGLNYNSLSEGDEARVTISILVDQGDGTTRTDTAIVTVLGVNDKPNAEDDAAATNENAAIQIDVLDNDTDPDAADTLHISSASLVSGAGTVAVSAGGTHLIYDPAGAYESLAKGETAQVQITYTVSDGAGGSDTATVTVTVAGRNDAPDAVRDTATTDEQTPLVVDVLANDTDTDTSDQLSVQSAAVVDGLGTVSVAADGLSISYDPGDAYQHLAVGESELVTIRYEVSDGNGGTDVALALVTVTGVNDVPQASDDRANTDQVSAVVIDPLANDTDTDASDTLSITSAAITSGLGTIRVSADGALLVYDPGDAYTDLAVGETAIVRATYTISDGNGGSSSANVVIRVGGNNDIPTANPDEASTGETSAVSIDVLANDTDPDSDPLSVVGATILDGQGSVSVSADGLHVNYDPGLAYNALAVGESEVVVISYTISDGKGGTSQSTATVTVLGENDAPNAVVDTAETTERAPLAIPVVDNDTDPDTTDTLGVVDASILSGLGSVSISADGQQVLYDPGDAYNALAKGETADVIIRYTVSDGNGGTDNARIFLTIRGQNDAPTARDDAAITDEDISVVVAALANDSDPDTTDSLEIIAVSVIDGLGTASIAADGLSLIYDPAGDYNDLSVGTSATVRLSYTISDGNGGTSQAEVTIRIDGRNDAPTARRDVDSTDEDTSVVIPVLANDTDPDADDTLSVISAQITDGLGSVDVSADGLGVVYDPDGAYEDLAVGESVLVRIRYTISDGNGGEDNAFIEVTVHGANDAPVAVDDVAATDEETAVSFDVISNDTDIDTSDVLTVIAASVPVGMGSVSVDPSGTSITFDPGLDFQHLPAGVTTTVDITYTVSDGNGGTDIGTATVTITGVNDSAVIGGTKTGEVTERDETDTTGGVLTISDIDDGEDSFIASVQTGIYGTLALAATGIWIYTLDNADPDTIALSFDDSVTDVFTITSLDGTTDEIVITVNGAGFDFEYNDFGGNSGSSQFKSIDSGAIEASQIDLIITPMPLLLDGGVENTVNATQTDLGIGTGQTISDFEGVRLEIVTGANDGNQNDIAGFTYDTHVAVQTFKTGVVQVQGDQSQSATVLIRIVFADDDSNFDTQADAGDIVIALSPSDLTVTKAAGNLLTTEIFQIGDSVVISGLQEGDILTVSSSQVFNRVEIENASDEISPLTGLAFGGNDFEIGVLGFNMPDELLLIGDAGSNVLTGEESNDTLDGRGGLDTLIGGGGVDVFVLGDDLSTGGLADIFVDYQQGVDVIDVTSLFDLAPGAFTEAALQEFVRYISPSDNDADDPAGSVGEVYVDLNGAVGGENFVLAAHVSTSPDSVIFKVDDGNQTDYVTII